jgi:hypothetical protein
MRISVRDTSRIPNRAAPLLRSAPSSCARPDAVGAPSPPGRGNTLAGIDGLYWYDGGFVAVQYGTRVRRIIRAGLSADGLRVVSHETLEQRTPLVSFPTTGAVVGDNFYYIANTGIGNLDDDTIVDPNKLEPNHIAVVRLGSSARAPASRRPINARP